MHPLKSAAFITMICFTACTPKIKNDKSIGQAEATTYNALTERLTNEMKNKFNGNMYQNEKITPVEFAEGIKIGIPGVINYTFRKDNSKFVKGDLNNDKKTDLGIWADMIESQGYETKMYFVFLQGKEGYEYFIEFKADDMVDDYCRKAKFNKGIFNLDSISGGLLIGSTDYQGNHEPSYLSYSYRIATEKYKLNITPKDLVPVYQSGLLKKNDATGLYEKADQQE